MAMKGVKRLGKPWTGRYGTQKIGKTTNLFGRLVGPENPDGRMARDIGVRVRRGRR